MSEPETKQTAGREDRETCVASANVTSRASGSNEVHRAPQTRRALTTAHASCGSHNTPDPTCTQDVHTGYTPGGGSHSPEPDVHPGRHTLLGGSHRPGLNVHTGPHTLPVSHTSDPPCTQDRTQSLRVTRRESERQSSTGPPHIAAFTPAFQVAPQDPRTGTGEARADRHGCSGRPCLQAHGGGSTNFVVPPPVPRGSEPAPWSPRPQG